MYLLDTDTLTHLWAGHERVRERLQEVDDTEVGTTSVSKCEILRQRCENLLKANSAVETIRAQRRLDRSERLLTELMIRPFDESAGEEFDQLLKDGRLKAIGRADLLIACIALANRATLVTRNLKHFRRVPRLMVENWVD